MKYECYEHFDTLSIISKIYLQSSNIKGPNTKIASYIPVLNQSTIPVLNRKNDGIRPTCLYRILSNLNNS